jgi:tRNA nucleotidyltransferase (CCA-adding enzyme)
MTKPHWEHFAHEADMGVVGIGATLEDAFEQAALAMTAIITDPGQIAPEVKVDIQCGDLDIELLFVDWLNALIYEMSSNKMLFSRFEVALKEHRLEATAWGEKIDVARHQPVVEIKGATYTALRVYQDDDGLWHAQTVVDV